MWEKCLNFVSEILIWIGGAAQPLLDNDGLIIMFAFVSLILGPLLSFANRKLRKQTFEDVFESLENSCGYYGIISKLFYYPVVFATSLLCTLSGQGGNTGIFQGMVSSTAKTTFTNFLEWDDTCKYFFTFLFLYVLLKTLFSLLKFRFFRLLRFYLHTINFITLGFLVASLYMVLVDASGGNILMTLVSLAVGLPLYSVFIMVFIGMLAPLVLIVLPFIIPFIGPLAILFGVAPAVMPVKHENGLDVLGHFALVNAWANLFSA